MKRVVLSLMMVALTHAAIAQEIGKMATKPSISPDGSMISFSYQGDIWTANIDGSNAKRLTIHEAYETNPKWSRDGSMIAFNGQRFGNYDIYTIDADGGNSNRITYHSSNDVLTDWAPDGHLIFETSRVFDQVERDAEMYAVSAMGGTPFRHLDSFGNYPNVSPNGRFIAHTRGNCRISREAYDGPADRDIWIFDTKTETYTELTDNSIQDFMPVWGDDSTLYYISARTGRYNIYKQAMDANGKVSGEPVALTSFTDEGIRAMDVSADNSTIIFERDTNLYTVSTSGGNVSTVNLDIKADNRFDDIESRTFSNGLTYYDMSPNGDLVSLVIRGEVFITEADKDKNRTVNVSKHPYRENNAAWLNDSTLIFVSDREGQYDMYLARSSDPDKPNMFKSLKHEVIRLTDSKQDEMRFLLSPDRKKIAYQIDRGMLIVADINENGKMSNKKTLIDGWDAASGLAWSPDSKWLAYSHQDLNFDSEIFIHKADNSMDPVNVSMHPKTDVNPVWSADGSKLGFRSNRNNGDYDIWYVWLTEEDFEKTKRDREEGYYFDDEEEEKSDKKGKDKGKKDEVKDIKIDFDNIHNRVFQLTFLPGSEGSLQISKDGDTFYFSSSAPGVNGSDIYSVKYDRSELKQVTKGGQSIFGLSWSPDMKNLLGVRRGSLVSLNPSSGKVTSMPFRAEMDIDHMAEREQILEEAWRELDKGFYDPEFHGRDWKALKAKYKPWAMAASTKQDFGTMANWMLGQLNASHMGIFGGATPEDTQSDRTGLVGIEVKPHSNGVEITKVVMNAPADKEKSKLNVGDVIRSVNGEDVSSGMNFWSLMEGTVNDQVLMTVADSKGKTREQVIQPTGSLSTLLYEEYVASRKALVDKYSDGKLGYIHIRAMNFTSFERFERELKASGYGKDGIVIDVRWNGGGSTTDLLMAVLNVQQHAYTIPRGAAKSLKDHTKFTETYPLSRLPLSAWYKPSIAMCNQTSYSNAEIFSHAFKNVGIGKLVGMPTFGAVISTGGAGLIDGSFVRMPFRGWFVKATGENMEHGPAVPDILVENEPDSKAKGDDPQLRRAVDELLKDIK